MLTHAILATDLSKPSDVLIAKASELHNIGVEKITLVFVYRSLVCSLNIEEVEMRGLVNIKDLKKKLARQKEQLEEAGFEATSEFLIGVPSKTLRSAVKDFQADVLIIGSNGYSESDVVLGSTAYEVLNNVENPVLLMVLQKEKDSTKAQQQPDNRVVGKNENKEGGSKWTLLSESLTKHILLPTDFSDFAEEAFQTLKALKGNIAELTLMHIQDEVRIKDHLSSKLDEFNKIDTARLGRLKEAFEKAHPETKVNTHIAYGKPKEKILDYINSVRVNRVSLTIMGSQGRGFLSRLFLGSVSHYVARHADSNVLLVPLKH